MENIRKKTSVFTNREIDFFACSFFTLGFLTPFNTEKAIQESKRKKIKTTFSLYNLCKFEELWKVKCG